MFSPGRCPRRSSLVQDARLRLEDELPHDPDDHRGHRPRHERERAGEPAAAQRLAEQEREPEREARTGSPSPRRAQMRPILNELTKRSSSSSVAEVVEADEVRRDVEPCARVREAEVDAPGERQHAEDDDRQQRRDEQDERLGRRQARARPGPAPGARRAACRRRERALNAAAAEEPRTTSRGSTPTMRGSPLAVARCARRSSSAAIRARSAEPRSTVVSVGQVTSDRARCCPCRRARRPRARRRPASRSAARTPTARRSFAQRIASGRAALEQALCGGAAGIDHEVGRDLHQRPRHVRASRSAARPGSRAGARTLARCAPAR